MSTLQKQKPCKCGCEEFYKKVQPVESPHAAGLYCVACDRWQRWLKRSEFQAA